MKESDLLDLEIFTCCKCGGQFDHTQGTWLPIAEKSKPMISECYKTLTVLSLSDFLKPPQIIYSDDFTCYDCCP